MRDLIKRVQLGAHRDVRGTLWPLDFSALPFTPVRAFLVEAPQGVVRGGHAHVQGSQLLVCVSGRIAVNTRFNGLEESHALDETGDALLISSPVWAQQTYLAPDSRLLVFCDTPYDPDAYLRDAL